MFFSKESETHQQRHDELVQVNNLDAAHVQLQSAISFGGVSVTDALCGVRSQTHGEAEHLITHDGDGLKDRNIRVQRVLLDPTATETLQTIHHGEDSASQRWRVTK